MEILKSPINRAPRYQHEICGKKLCQHKYRQEYFADNNVSPSKN